MATDADLLAMIIANPADDAPRLAYADLVDRKGDPRGAFIRLQIRLRDVEVARSLPADYGALLDEHDALLRAHGDRWAEPVRGLVDGWRFVRGFIDEVKLDAAAFLQRAPAVYAAAPVLNLNLTGGKDRMDAVAASPHLGRIRALGLDENGIGDAGAHALAASPHVRELRWLDLFMNKIGRPGLEALCASSNLPSLRFARLTSNGFPDPDDAIGEVDGYRIVEWDRPPIQIELEAKYGRKRWFHWQVEDLRFYPPRPEAVTCLPAL
jgi:uncharacterized protein (TIGR02996 family)